MSDSIDRMRARREALTGDTPSLFAPGELQLRAPTMDSSPSASAPAPTSSNSSSFVNATASAAPAAISAISSARHKGSHAPESAKAGFFSQNVPGVNLPLWGVLLGSVGVLALGVGVYKTVMAPKAVR